jgi:hypothetical protein
MITVELFESFDQTWWWRCGACLLQRGPFTTRREADDDAIAVAADLVAVLAEDEAETS